MNCFLLHLLFATAPNYCSCPHCNSKNIVKNGDRERNIKFVPFQSYNIELNLSVKRHICKDCKKSFSPSTNIVADNSNISNNLKFTIAHELQENASLTSITKRYNISVSSVQRIMDECYGEFKVNKEHLPETMCIDEFKSVKNIDGAMSFVFADHETKNIIDIVEDRRPNSLTEYFSRYVNFNIYQDIFQSIKHNNFKRFEDTARINSKHGNIVDEKTGYGIHLLILSETDGCSNVFYYKKIREGLYYKLLYDE